MSKLLKHVGFIMDGNGRWAKEKGLSRSEGHKAGLESLENLIKCSLEFSIPYNTVYAFSSENWKRPKTEILFIFSLLHKAFKKLAIYKEKGVKINVIGDKANLPKSLQKIINTSVEQTKDNKRLIFTVAFNYGARCDIVKGIKKIVQDIKYGKLKEEDITEDLFSKYLSTGSIPDPDLIIRTSGEQRLSNFLLWESSYSEFIFEKKNWPDFSKEDYLRAINSFLCKNRRYGNIND